MRALVERMLELHRRQAAAQTPADRELYARQIAATDGEIDALAYELRPRGAPGGEAGVGYGLTEEEIAVVEGSG
jgi:hypothetical protein